MRRTICWTLLAGLALLPVAPAQAVTVRTWSASTEAEFALGTLDGTTIRAMAFLAYGCPHLIAAAEAACAELERKDAVELLEFSAAGLMQSLSVPVEKTGRILVLEDAIRSLGRVITETE